MRDHARVVGNRLDGAAVVVSSLAIVSGSSDRRNRGSSKEGKLGILVVTSVVLGSHRKMTRNSDLGSRKLSARGSNNLNIGALSVKLYDVDVSKMQGVPFPSNNRVIARGKVRWESEGHGLKVLHVALVPLSDLEPFLLVVGLIRVVGDISEAISGMSGFHRPLHRNALSSSNCSPHRRRH